MGGQARSLCFCWAFAAACVLGAVSATAAELEVIRVPARVESVPWTRSRALSSAWRNPAGPRTFALNVDNGHCIGLTPELDHIEVIEQPRMEGRPFKAAIITVFKRWPEHDEYVRPPAQSGKPTVITICAGIGGTIERRLKLKRPVDSLFLYDGSYSPPRQVLTPQFQHGDPIAPPSR